MQKKHIKYAFIAIFILVLFFILPLNIYVKIYNDMELSEGDGCWSQKSSRTFINDTNDCLIDVQFITINRVNKSYFLGIIPYSSEVNSNIDFYITISSQTNNQSECKKYQLNRESIVLRNNNNQLNILDFSHFIYKDFSLISRNNNDGVDGYHYNFEYNRNYVDKLYLDFLINIKQSYGKYDPCAISSIPQLEISTEEFLEIGYGILGHYSKFYRKKISEVNNEGHIVKLLFSFWGLI